MTDYERGYYQGKADATKLMRQALDAFEWNYNTDLDNIPACEQWAKLLKTNITALRDRLAQKEQEPVTGNLLKDAYNAMVEKKTRSQKLREAGFTRRPKGWEKEKDEQEPVAVWELQEDGWDTICDGDWLETLPVGTKLYTIPPQRKPLTDEEMRECAKAMDAEPLAGGWPELIKFARAIEAAHGIKP